MGSAAPQVSVSEYRAPSTIPTLSVTLSVTLCLLLTTSAQAAPEEGDCKCPRIFKPVCDVDGQTHSNKWCMGCEGKVKKCEGACPCETKSNEGKAAVAVCNCRNRGRPVCGEDGRTYRNMCELKCRGDVRRACRGRCPCK